MVVPVSELVRACFAHNRALAEVLLRPNAVREIVHSYKVDGHELELWFHKDVPRNYLTKTFVRQVARILCLPRFAAAWEHTSRALTQQKQAWSAEAVPPLQSTWRLRGIKYEQTLLVLEITAITLVEALPVQLISYGVIGQLKQRTIASQDSKKVVHLRPKGTVTIDTTGAGVTKKKISRKLPHPAPPLSDPKPTRLQPKLSDEEAIEVPKIVVNPKDETEKVGLTRGRREGSLRPGEFETPGAVSKSNDSSDEQLKLNDPVLVSYYNDFAVYLNELSTRLVKPLEIFQITLMLGPDRDVGVVIAVIQEPSCLPAYLIELEALSARKAATLLVTASGRKDQDDDIERLGEMFAETITPQVNWSKTRLELVHVLYPWIVHVHRLLHVGTPKEWTLRVEQKLVPMRVKPKMVEGDGGWQS